MATIESAGELGERIRGARTGSGRTQADLAAMLGMERSALARVESGERKVSALELLQISRSLDLPLSYFVNRTPAAISSFRQSVHDEPLAAPHDRFRCEALLQAHLLDLELLSQHGLLEPVRGLPRGPVRDVQAAADLARAVRAFLDCPTAPLPGMVEVAERLGLFLLVADVAAEGACLTSEAGLGVGLVSDRPPPGRRRFTAAHEIGHYILQDEYQTDLHVASSRDEREVVVDAFAAELLLPRQGLREAWQSRDDDARTRLLNIAATFRVSWGVAVRAAGHARLVSLAQQAQLSQRAPELTEFLAVLGKAPEEDITPSSVRPLWTKAVITALRRHLVTPARAAELLNQPELAQHLAQHSEPQPSP